MARLMWRTLAKVQVEFMHVVRPALSDRRDQIWKLSPLALCLHLLSIGVALILPLGQKGLENANYRDWPGAVASDWGSSMNALQTRLIARHSQFPVGEPVNLRLELCNRTWRRVRYRTVNLISDNDLEVIGPDGRRLHDHSGLTGCYCVVRSEIRPGKRRIIGRGDLSQYWDMNRPGRYGVRFVGQRPWENRAGREQFSELPPSPLIEFELAAGSGGRAAGEALGQKPPEETIWGEAVEGVQVRLWAEKAIWQWGEVPTLKGTVRNLRASEVRIPEGQEVCRLQVDEQWFRGGAAGRAAYMSVKPGSISKDIVFTLNEVWSSEEAGKPLRMELGRHAIRVGVPLSIPPAQGPPTKPLQAISNAVEVTIERALPGSRLSIQEAMKEDFAFAAVCEAVGTKNLPSIIYDGHIWHTGQGFKVQDLVAGQAPGTEAIVLLDAWTNELERIETGERVIWIARNMGWGGAYRGVKALPDTPENRKAVVEAAKPEAGWGEAVEGVQVRLWAEKAVWQWGEVPTLKGTVRNLSAHEVRIPQGQDVCRLQVNEQWFRGGAAGDAAYMSVKPGSISKDIVFTLNEVWSSEEAGKPLRMELGRHAIRVGVPVLIPPAQGPATKPLQAISNAVEVTIERALPGSRLSIQEAMKDKDFAFAAVCQAVGDAAHLALAIGTTLQDYRVLQLLAGKVPDAEKITIRYFSIIGPVADRPIAKGERVIWIVGKFGETWNGLKALSDTPENRQAIREELAWGPVSNGLQCRLLPLTQTVEVAEGTKRDDLKVYVTFGVRNRGKEQVKVVTVNTPLEDIAPYLAIFDVVSPDGKKMLPISLAGDILRAPPFHEELEPGATISRRTQLRYDFTNPGAYQISITLTKKAEDNLSWYYGHDADKAKQNPDNVWTGTLKSNTVTVDVLREAVFAAVCEAEYEPTRTSQPPDAKPAVTQQFKILEVLTPGAYTDSHILKLEYSPADVLGPEGRAPQKGQRLIWLIRRLSPDRKLGLKALEDTPENRELVKTSLGGVTLTGRVLSKPQGAPAGGATVEFFWGAGNVGWSAETQSAPDGTYSFHHLTPCAYRLRLAAAPGLDAGVATEGVLSEVADKDVHADDLFVTLPQSVSGTVRDARTGEPVKGVAMNTVDGSLIFFETDDRGRYRLYVTPRIVKIVCFPTRNSPQGSQVREVPVEAGQHVENVDFDIRREN